MTPRWATWLLERQHPPPKHTRNHHPNQHFSPFSPSWGIHDQTTSTRWPSWALIIPLLLIDTAAEASNGSHNKASLRITMSFFLRWGWTELLLQILLGGGGCESHMTKAEGSWMNQSVHPLTDLKIPHWSNGPRFPLIPAELLQPRSYFKADIVRESLLTKLWRFPYFFSHFRSLFFTLNSGGAALHD